MTDEEKAELETLRLAQNETSRAYNAEPSEANRLARNEAARLYQKRRIALDPDYANRRAEDSRRFREAEKDKKNSG